MSSQVKTIFFKTHAKTFTKLDYGGILFVGILRIFLSFSLSSPSPSLSFCFIWQYSPPRTNNFLFTYL